MLGFNNPPEPISVFCWFWPVLGRNVTVAVCAGFRPGLFHKPKPPTTSNRATAARRQVENGMGLSDEAAAQGGRSPHGGGEDCGRSADRRSEERCHRRGLVQRVARRRQLDAKVDPGQFGVMH